MISKVLLVCATFVGFSTAYANETTDPLTVYTEENALQLQAEYEEDLELMMTPLSEPMTEIQQRHRGDRDRRHVRRPPHYRPRPIPVPRRQQHTCYARNIRGQLFSATAQNRNVAQHRAMQRCDRYSVICRPAGCRTY